jgi:Na+-transporting NADH:ubiquinone oxidoreductase subunit NqrB
VSTAPAADARTTMGNARSAPRFDRRYLAPMLITLVLVAGQLSFGFLESWSRTAIAIVTSILAEMLLGRVFVGVWPHLASAYVTGISGGILVRSPEYWPYALCSALSIASKYLIRVDGRHIFNPSNLGIVAMLLLAADTVASLSVQWGNNLLPLMVVWFFGAAIIASVGRFHITLTYVVSFIVLSVLRSAMTGHPWLSEVAPLTGPMYQLFIFFMITDPKTTVGPRWAQSLVAFLVAVVEAVLRLMQVVNAPFYALFMVGPSAVLLEIALKRRSAAQRQPIASP